MDHHLIHAELRSQGNDSGAGRDRFIHDPAPHHRLDEFVLLWHALRLGFLDQRLRVQGGT